jgi:hypothetical protein
LLTIYTKIDAYVYGNDKELLEFVVSAQGFMDSATVIYNNLISANKEYFTYEDGVQFYSENSGEIARLLDAYISLKDCEESIKSKSYSCFVQDVYSAYDYTVCAFAKAQDLCMEKYIHNIKYGIDEMKEAMLLLNAVVEVNGATDLEYYQAEKREQEKEQEATLDNFLPKARIVTALMEKIYGNINGLYSLEENVYEVAFANEYLRQLYEIKDELLETFNDGVAHTKIVEVYQNIERIYMYAIDYNSLAKQEVDNAVNQIYMNLDVLTFIDELLKQ